MSLDPTIDGSAAVGADTNAGTVEADSTTETPPEDAKSTGTTQPATGGDDNTLGDAGKKALQAERDARDKAEKAHKAATAELDAFKDALAQALGVKNTDEQDPSALAEQLGQRDAALTQARAENAVLRAGTGVANVDMLLDSKRFTDTLTGLDVTDPAKVKAHVEEFVDAHPQYRAGTAGARDAAAGRGRETLPPVQPGVARLAQGLEAELNK